MKNIHILSLLLLGVFLATAVPLLEAQVPVINSAGNATAQVAVPFTYRITATNGPTSYSIISSGPSSLIQGVYRGAFGSQTAASGKIWMSGSGQEFPNGPAFAAITSNGSAVAWGNPAAGGNATAVSSSLSSNVTAIYSNSQAFAALKSNGSVVTWGDGFSGGSASGAVGSNLTSGVVSISSTTLAFAALKSNGSVVTWGDSESGGNSISRVGGNLTSNVTAVFSNAGAFAALKSNGSVVTWGAPLAGGNSTLFELDQDFNTFETSVASQLTSGVVSISSAQGAFAARKSDGSVVTWGDMAARGAYTPPSAGSLSSNVTAVFSNDDAFAALKSNGSVVTWGDPMSGGDSSSVSANLSSNVTAIFSNSQAFAALKSNGSVVTWGGAFFGGDSSSPIGGNLASNVKSISSTQWAFAALKNDGSVVTWGPEIAGGDCSNTTGGTLTSNVTAVYATQRAFAALKSDGSVVTWGSANLGGDSSSVAASLSSNVTAIAANSGAFAALKRDGSVVTWGLSTPIDIPAPANIGAPAVDITSLTGLSFNSANGSLTGSPTKSGNFSLRIGATNASGTGNAPFSLLILSAPGMSLSGNLSFGNVFVGQNATRNFSIANPASGPLTVTAITSSNSSFSLTETANFTVSPSTTQNVTVRFQPSVAGNFSSSITIASNAGNNSLTATGSGVPATTPTPLPSPSPTPVSTPTITSVLSANGTVGVPFSYQITASNTPTSFGNATALPAGLILNSTTGLISGTPATVGNTTVTLTATNAGGTGNATLVLRIAAAPLATSQFTGGKFGSPLVNGLNDIDGDGVNDVSLADLGSFAAIDATGGYGLTGESGGGAAWVRGNSTIVAPDQAGKNEAFFSPFRGNIMSSSDNWSKVRFSSGDGWVQWKFAAGSSPVIPLVFVREAPAQNLSAAQAWEVAYRGPAITSAASANGSVGTAFNFQVTASNNATSFSASSLPAGLTINATTGLISGTPTAVGSSIITLSATNASGIGVANLTLTISPSRMIGLTGNLSFGNATVNSTTTRNLTITNTGTGNLTITGISSSNASFVLTGNTTNLVVGPGGNRTVGVVFQPASAGNFTGTITVNSTATNAVGNSTIPASGTGVSSLIISLTGNLSFGSVGINATATRTLSISNTGNGPLTVTGISYPSGFSGNFTGTINPNATQNVTVSFRPTTAGNFNGTITVNSTATSGNSTIATSGTGVLAPVITSNLSASGAVGGNFSYQITASNNPASFGNATALPAGLSLNATTGLISGKPTAAGNSTVTLRATNAGGTGTANLTVSISQSRIIALSGNLSFGNATVNSTLTRNLTITNTGTGPLSVSGISYPPGFSGNWSGTINATATQNVTVSFRPTSESPITGNITVNSDSTSGTPTIAASGSGVHSRIIGLSGNLSFGSVGVNATANRTLSISNIGTGPLAITGISYPTGFSGNFSGTINPNATQNVTVSFRPTTAGNFAGNITVTSTATSGNATTAVSGTAIAAPVITTTNLHGTKGLSFSQRILATNNATTFVNATALPLGLTINRTTGLISGTMPEGSLIFSSVNITATSAFGSTTAPVTFWFWDDLLSVAGGALKTSNELNNTLVPTFRIGKYEVTWFEWKAVREWAVANGYTDLADVGAGSGDLHPVRDVNWYDVVKWCNAKSERDGLTPVYQVGGVVYRTGQSVPIVNSAAKGYRLATEAEWEWAARGGVGSGNYTYSGSNDVNSVAWYAINSAGGTKQFATKKANDLGIHDMSGNVAEWCWDSVSSNRRTRGGSWSSSAGNCTVASRGINRNPDSRNGDSGLRLARSLDEPTSIYGTVGMPVSYQLAAANNPTSFGNATALPAGLSLNGTTGLISGTPMVAGNSTVTLRATSAGVTGTANVTFSIKSDLVSIQGGTLPQSSALWGTPVLTFRIGTFEVTRSLWQNVRTWGAANGYTDLPSIDPGINANHPVQEVSWYDALKWCNARSAMENLTPVYKVGNSVYKTGQTNPSVDASATGYRLPTEAEWEWAARGGVSTKGYTYSGGNDLQAVGRFSRGSSGVWPVGGLAANEIGLYDMSGNVKEWCWDVWSDDGKISRRQRGGSWSSGESQCALSDRGGSPFPQNRYDDIGFRLARKSGN